MVRNLIKSSNNAKITLYILGIITLTASVLRFFNLNWDHGNFFHPDERNIAMAVSNITLFSQMDPKFYAYGGFLIYIYKITADILSLILNNPEIPKDWAWINLIGRTYSAFFSTLTILPLFLMGRKLFGKSTALLCCILYAVTVGSFQTAHYATTENLLTLLIVTLTYTALIYYERPKFKIAVIIGLLLGIAAATKTTGLSFGIVPAATMALLLLKRKVSLIHLLSMGLLIGATALITFTVSSPFTFLNSEKFLESMEYENAVVKGTNPVPYTLQFNNTTPYLFQIKNLFWQLGPMVSIVFIGILTTAWQEIRRRRMLLVIFLSFPLAYFLYIGSWHTKFIRYMVLLLPFLLLFGSNFLTTLTARNRLAGSIVSAIVIVISVCYALAFFSIYTREQTRVTASQWIYKNVPNQSTILTEHWDEGLPIPLPEGHPGQYTQIALTIYDPDNEGKLQYYAFNLSEADYIAINSRRLYGTLLYLPEKYPLTKRYYEQLFAGNLGYEKVAQFTSYPSLLGVEINDDASEETFQVYDHPKVLIFKNTERFSSQKIESLLR